MTALHPSRWTLRTKLVASVLALFFLVTAAVGALSVWQLDKTLMSQVDQQLTTSRDAMTNGGDAGNGPVGGSVAGNSSLQLQVYAGSSTPTTLADPRTGDSDKQAWIMSPRGRAALTSAQIDQLLNAGLGRDPVTLDLKGAGSYRLIAVQHTTEFMVSGSHSRVLVSVVDIVGLPTRPVRDNVDKMALAVALLSGAGILVVGMASALLIQRNLEPLRRVAGTARRVSQLQLSRGEVDIAERVGSQDTDPHTEVGQVGHALNDLLDHMGAALTARQASETRVRRFVADASHELRTPLASIRGYAELSRREQEPVPTGVTHALGRIESEADRMTALVEDLLLLARLDSGRPLDRTPVDLSMLLIETVSDAHAAGPEHTWNLDLPDGAVEVIGDGPRLRQVIINLLANARRHTPAGTIVTAGVRADDTHAVVTVRDNGPGIPADLTPHIFERFTRGDSARTRTGGSTGLGLSIVQAVVASHGGTVSVDSVPGNTVFTVTLPVAGPVGEATDHSDESLIA
ncbi:sensor histidine kinase [Calidifontibacter terrae]